MDSNEKYNGWTNIFTWNVALWLGNEEYYESRIVDELLPEALKNAKNEKQYSEFVDLIDTEQRTITELSDMLKDMIEEEQEEQVGNTGMFSDLLNKVFGRVDWRKIAEHYVGDNLDESDFSIEDEEDEEDEEE
jgi:hypothetical protein